MTTPVVLWKKVIGGIIIGVTISAGPFEIEFIKKGEKICKKNVRRMDKEIINPEDLYIPSYLYKLAIGVAYKVLVTSQRRQKRKKGGKRWVM